MDKPKTLRVKAFTRRRNNYAGQYVTLKRDGEIFNLIEKRSHKGKVISVCDQFSETWMKDVDDSLDKEKDGSFKKVDKSYVLRPKPLKSGKKEA